MFNRSMGHFLFQSIFYLSIIFKMPQLSIFIQFLQLEVQASRQQFTWYSFIQSQIAFKFYHSNRNSHLLLQYQWY